MKHLANVYTIGDPVLASNTVISIRDALDIIQNTTLPIVGYLNDSVKILDNVSHTINSLYRIGNNIFAEITTTDKGNGILLENYLLDGLPLQVDVVCSNNVITEINYITP